MAADFGVGMGAMSLDCFPRNRGTASAVQAFLQMNLNALTAALAVANPRPHIVTSMPTRSGG